jgi:translation initiation factor IF-2
MTRPITSAGQGEPAMMPVRNVDSVVVGEIRVIEQADEHGRHAVQAGAAFGLHVSSTAFGSKLSPGKTMVAPCVTQARLPSTMPKQW